MISRICFSASSTSLEGRCFCFAVMISMSSDFVMLAPHGPFPNPGTRMCPAAAGGGAAGKKPRFLPAARWAGQDARIQRCKLVAISDVLLEQVAQAGARGGRLRRAVALHRLRLFVRFLRLDGERDGARLAVDA